MGDDLAPTQREGRRNFARMARKNAILARLTRAEILRTDPVSIGFDGTYRHVQMDRLRQLEQLDLAWCGKYRSSMGMGK